MNAVNFLNLEYIFLRLIELFRGFDLVAILNWILWFIGYLRPIALIVILFLVYVIVYSKIKIRDVKESEQKKFHPISAVESVVSEQDSSLVTQWQEVQRHMNSTNSSDWRLAILEADIMLEEILEKQGYQGDTIGDKLKGVDRSDMTSLDAAWDAHKVRNQIAHEGVGFQINEREAKRVIGLYQKVFEEFYHL
jgi:hypothetical protein